MATDAMTPVVQETQAFQKGLEPITIGTRDDYAKAGDTVKMVSNKVKELEEKRFSMTRPLDDTKKQIMDEFKRITQPLEGFIAETKQTMLAWARAEQAREAERQRIERERIAAEEAKRQEEERTAAEARRKEAEAMDVPSALLDDEPEDETAPEPIAEAAQPEPEKATPKTERGSFATTTIKQNWTFEILDDKAVPRDFCEPSKDHIRQAIAAGAREIPGVRIWDAGTVAIR